MKFKMQLTSLLLLLPTVAFAGPVGTGVNLNSSSLQNFNASSMKSLNLPVSIPSNLSSYVGTNSGGGGDSCEARIQEIRDDILAWIRGGGPARFKNMSVSLEEYSIRMSYFLMTSKEASGAIRPVTQIECVHHPVEAQGVEKVCRFDDFSYGPKITCYAEAFLDKNTMGPDEQYKLIHHEYAGLSKLEVPLESQSNYLYSSQISAFLENQVVKKLAIKPMESPAPTELPTCNVSDTSGDGYEIHICAGDKLIGSMTSFFNRAENQRKALSKVKEMQGLVCNGYQVVDSNKCNGMCHGNCQIRNR